MIPYKMCRILQVFSGNMLRFGEIYVLFKEDPDLSRWSSVLNRVICVNSAAVISYM